MAKAPNLTSAVAAMRGVDSLWMSALINKNGLKEATCLGQDRYIEELSKNHQDTLESVHLIQGRNRNNSHEKVTVKGIIALNSLRNLKSLCILEPNNLIAEKHLYAVAEAIAKLPIQNLWLAYDRVFDNYKNFNEGSRSLLQAIAEQLSEGKKIGQLKLDVCELI